MTRSSAIETHSQQWIQRPPPERLRLRPSAEYERQPLRAAGPGGPAMPGCKWVSHGRGCQWTVGLTRTPRRRAPRIRTCRSSPRPGDRLRRRGSGPAPARWSLAALRPPSRKRRHGVPVGWPGAPGCSGHGAASRWTSESRRRRPVRTGTECSGLAGARGRRGRGAPKSSAPGGGARRCKNIVVHYRISSAGEAGAVVTKPGRGPAS